MLVTATLTPLDSTTKATVVPEPSRMVRTVPGMTMPSSWKVLLPRVARLGDRLVRGLEEHDRRGDPLEDEETDRRDDHDPDHFQPPALAPLFGAEGIRPAPGSGRSGPGLARARLVLETVLE